MMSPVSTVESLNDCSALLNKSDQTAMSALAAARKLLHRPDCDPREANLFGVINISLIAETVMARLRDLLCAVLSVRDRRPWSRNGKRIAVNKLTTYLGKISKFLSLVNA